MFLCLDIGNTQIFGGVYCGDKLEFSFRHATTHSYTSDQFGIFFKNVLRENNIEPGGIEQIAICSVVPHLDYSIRSACIKYFSIEPFMLQPGVRTGIKIKYANPAEVGTDIIAETIAAVHLYPQQNVIIVDFGTATTFCPITKQKEFLGGIIMPGFQLSMESLQSKTAKLPTVRIVKPEKTLGSTTVESIQVGLYYQQLSAAREITARLTKEVFDDKKPVIIGTGGFAHLFETEGIFTKIIPNIVLKGLLLALKMNHVK